MMFPLSSARAYLVTSGFFLIFLLDLALPLPGCVRMNVHDTPGKGVRSLLLPV
jgi:hypothetical protein